jgi:uncharacterized protein (DUF2236 family)
MWPDTKPVTDQLMDLRNLNIDSVRDWLGDQLRTRVAGENADQRAAEILDAPGPHWFGPEEPIRIVHADASMFVGGLRALLFQSLHPLAMAGVATHSDYRADPWGRLQRTSDFLFATTFGPAAQAERAVEIVHRVHERVTGTASDGRPYAANDPHLLRWVHVAEVDSFLTAFNRHGAQKLSPEMQDRYVANTAVIARALGSETPPESVAELREQLRAFRPELRGTPEARQGAQYLLFKAPLPPAGLAVYGVLAAAAVAMLPAWARLPLRLPYLPVTEAVALRPAGEALTRTLRWAMAPESRFN